MAWLQKAAGRSDSVLEAVGQNESGGIGGDFTNVGRVSALTGLSTPLGWPQHVWMWGEDYGVAARRWEAVRSIYQWPRDGSAAELLRAQNVQWIFIGAEERNLYPADGLHRLKSALTPVYTNGDTVVLRVSDE